MYNIYSKTLISTIALETLSISMCSLNTKEGNKRIIYHSPHPQQILPYNADGVQSPSPPQTKPEEQTKIEAIAGEHTSTPAPNILVYLKTSKTTGRSYKGWRR